MIHWGYVVLALFLGVTGGIILMAMMAAGQAEQIYRAGFREGHDEGFYDGLKQHGGTAGEAAGEV